MNYYPHHIGDFNSATRHLTRTERSVYRDLIELYYDTEAPLCSDFDKLCRLVLARSDEERTAVEQVLNEFFTETEQGWSHSRCDIEISKYHGNKEAKSAAGKASAAKRTAKAPSKPIISATPDEQKSNECSTGVQQPLNECATNQEPEPRTKNQKTEEKNTPPTPRRRGAVKPVAHSVSVVDLEFKGVPSDVATEFIALRNRKRAALTEIALAGIQRESDSLGWTLEQALRKCIERGWQGFDASWVQNQQRQSGPGQSGINRQEALEASNREIALRWAERNAG